MSAKVRIEDRREIALGRASVVTIAMAELRKVCTCVGIELLDLTRQTDDVITVGVADAATSKRTIA